MPISHDKRKEYRAAYIREHYKKNKKYYLDKASERRDRITALLRKLKEVPCTDCGEQYPSYVMHFDHLDGATKLINLSSVARKGWSEKKVLEEVSKCEVVCANCHAERTYQRRITEVWLGSNE